MEVLDGRPTPTQTPTGTSISTSPDPVGSHLEIGGLSPSHESIAHDSTPPEGTSSSACNSPAIADQNETNDKLPEDLHVSPAPPLSPAVENFTASQDSNVQPILHKANFNDTPPPEIAENEPQERKEEEIPSVVANSDSDQERSEAVELPLAPRSQELTNNEREDSYDSPCPNSVYPSSGSELHQSMDENERLEHARRMYEEEENRRQNMNSDLNEKNTMRNTLDLMNREQQLQENLSHVSTEEMQPQQRNHLANEGNTLPHHLEHHMENLQQNQHYVPDYHHPMLKLHLQEQHSRLREQAAHMHEYEDHQSMGADPRHLHDNLVDHAPNSDRLSNDGYWNMHLGMLSKVKPEAKDWYDNDGMVPDMNNGLKSDHELYNNYRMQTHPGGDSPSMNGPRPSPHGGIPYSQSPDLRQQQHYQSYHPGMRDMSPNYQGHSRGPMQQGSQMHGASQQLPQHMQHQHMQQQQYSGQQYGGQQQMNMQGHPGQQLPSPYAQGMMGPGMGGHEVREGREGDPYSFVDEYSGPPPRPVEEILGHTQPKRRGRKPKHIKLMENGGDPMAIAAAQAAHEAKKRKWRQMGPDGKPIPLPVKPRKRIDRFDGIPEDELSKKILPDHLGPNLDIVIISKFPFQIGINPGLFAAYKGHHYAGPGNHFWKCLFLSGLIPEPLTSDDDHQLLGHGIGFTNIVSRTTRGSAELTRKEIKEGGQILLSKLQRFQPRVAVFNGKGIYEIFSGKKEFTFGRQPEKIEGTHTHVWVMPSSSARCAQLPRALDKVPFYTALRKFRDFLKGTITELTEEEITFSCPRKQYSKEHLEKLTGNLEDEINDPFLEESLKDDLDSSRFESDLDTEEITRSISQSLYNLSGMTREQLEALDCPTIPIRKKRGRPKKSPEDPNAPPRPKPRNTYPTELLMVNGEEPPRKKRGRPKKVLEDGTIPPPKRPGRKPKALKEMLAAQGALGHGVVAGAGTMTPQGISGHLNGMISPSNYSGNPAAPPQFSPQFAGSQGHGVHPVNGPSMVGDRLSSIHHNMNSHPGLPANSLHGSTHPGANMLHSGSNSLPLPGCPTPNSNGGSQTPVHNSSMPTRGATPQGYGQSPGYSPNPNNPPPHQQLSSYGHDKGDLQLDEERQLDLSSMPASPVMAQPDFEPPTSLPESEPHNNMSDQSRNHQSHPDEGQLGMMDRQQHTPSIQSQFSNPSTPAEDYSSYSQYTATTSCSPSYNVDPSPSYAVAPVSNSPSYHPPNVSCSPSYQTSNTHSPSFNNTHSPSYHSNVAQSPSYLRNAEQSPSFPHTQSPSFAPVTQSPSYHPAVSHSPSYSSITRSPSYSASINQSPSPYPSNATQSPSYRPTTSQSPSFIHSPALNKPIAPSCVHSPQMTKSDVSSKSLSGLESLVDQIPSLNENEPHPSLANGPCSNPTTPGPPLTTDPFSPGHAAAQGASYPNFPVGGGGSFPSSHYNSPQPSNPYSPQYSSSSTNLSTNFSVSSLANSSLTTSLSYEVNSNSSSTATSSANAAPVSTSSALGSNSFSVSSLTGGSPTPVSSMYNSYSPVPPHSYSDMLGSSILPPTPPMGHSFMGSPGLMGSTPSPSLHSSMNSQLPYPYNQYPESAPGGYGAPHSFPYSASAPGFHVPSPRFPYPSPYPGGPYSQSYTQNSVLERIKQTGMGMGFGGF